MAPTVTPSHSSLLKITLKQPTQTHKPSRAPRAVHKDKDLDSDIESGDDDEYDHPREETAELALGREETACKRKHLSEKKLEDEKAETINRLLKKKSGA
ncbi:hypothetical protein BC827DRAFT_1270403 [Russula dissimulans]|nr:hypothetical protein BC827DRAFT_1270403 [Russula dissimulans]